jgi:hypothetical protein
MLCFLKSCYFCVEISSYYNFTVVRLSEERLIIDGVGGKP